MRNQQVAGQLTDGKDFATNSAAQCPTSSIFIDQYRAAVRLAVSRSSSNFRSSALKEREGGIRAWLTRRVASRGYVGVTGTLTTGLPPSNVYVTTSSLSSSTPPLPPAEDSPSCVLSNPPKSVKAPAPLVLLCNSWPPPPPPPPRRCGAMEATGLDDSVGGVNPRATMAFAWSLSYSGHF